MQSFDDDFDAFTVGMCTVTGTGYCSALDNVLYSAVQGSVYMHNLLYCTALHHWGQCSAVQCSRKSCTYPGDGR